VGGIPLAKVMHIHIKITPFDLIQPRYMDFYQGILSIIT
jgi:hypothetical protein